MIKADIVADSIINNNRLTSLKITFPRFILAELNTHRMLSKNSASSRAVPFSKMVESVKINPFIPYEFQKQHKGMQGNEYITGINKQRRIDQWLYARDLAVLSATKLYEPLSSDIYEQNYPYLFEHQEPVTKQLCNRILEPFMWHTVLLSGTEWDNFFNLRCPRYKDNLGNTYLSKTDMNNACFDGKNWSQLEWLRHNDGKAEIHMMYLAEAIYDAIKSSKPTVLTEDEWHIPFGDEMSNEQLISELEIDINDLGYEDKLLKSKLKIATARIARISYTVVGNNHTQKTFKDDIKLFNDLYTDGHYSPFEHCAKVMNDNEYSDFIKGNTIIEEYDDTIGWCNNYRGFVQLRYYLQTKNSNWGVL